MGCTYSIKKNQESKFYLNLESYIYILYYIEYHACMFIFLKHKLIGIAQFGNLIIIIIIFHCSKEYFPLKFIIEYLPLQNLKNNYASCIWKLPLMKPWIYEWMNEWINEFNWISDKSSHRKSFRWYGCPIVHNSKPYLYILYIWPIESNINPP